MYEELWDKNKGIVIKLMNQYKRACLMDNAVSPDDLVQAGFLGLVKAEQTFDPTAGKGWYGWAKWHIQMEFDSVLGLRRCKFTKAHAGTRSLDRPIDSSKPDGDTLGAILADTESPDVDEALLQQEMAREVRMAVGRLESERQRKVMLLWLDGVPFKEIADRNGWTMNAVYQSMFLAKNNLKNDLRLNEVIDGRKVQKVQRVSFDDMLADKETAKEVRAAVGWLKNEKQRKVISLWLDGVPFKEIADRNGWTMHAVYMLKARAIKQLIKMCVSKKSSTAGTR